MQELFHLVLHVALHAVGRGARLERDGQLERDRDLARLSHVHPGGDQSPLVDERGDAVDQVARGDHAGVAVLLLGLGHQEQRDAAVARLHALRPRHPARGGERELLVILGGDGAVAILDRIRAPALRLLDRLRIRAARGGEGVGHALHEGDALLQDGERAGSDVALHAAAEAVADLDRVAPGGRHPALAPVAEGDLALDRVARIVARAWLGIEEVLRLVPAHPGAVAILVGLDGLGPFLLLDDLALRGRRRVRLQHPQLRAGEERHVRDGEALVDRPVGGAQHLLQGDAVQRGDRVDHHRAQGRRQVVRARLQPGAQPVRLGVEDGALLELLGPIEVHVTGTGEPVRQVLGEQVRPAVPVPELPHHARALEDRVLFRRARSRTAQLRAATHRLGIVQLEVEVDTALGELAVEAQVEGRRLVLVGEEGLEVDVRSVEVVGVVAELEVVVALAVLHRLRLAHVLEDQRLEARRAQRAVFLEDPVLPDQLVAARRAVVARVDAGADPEVLLPADLGLHHVLRPVELHRSVARERAGRGN